MPHSVWLARTIGGATAPRAESNCRTPSSSRRVARCWSASSQRIVHSERESVTSPTVIVSESAGAADGNSGVTLAGGETFVSSTGHRRRSAACRRSPAVATISMVVSAVAIDGDHRRRSSVARTEFRKVDQLERRQLGTRRSRRGATRSRCSADGRRPPSGAIDRQRRGRRRSGTATGNSRSTAAIAARSACGSATTRNSRVNASTHSRKLCLRDVDQREDRRRDRALLLEQPVHRRLDVVGVFAQLGQADHPAAALERVKAAADRAQRLAVAGVAGRAAE